MLEINESDVFFLSDNAFLQKLEELGKYWVFNIETGEHYSLNETSYWILEQIALNLPIESILRDLVDTYDVDEEQGKNDLDETINKFLKEKIIKRRE
ncbi:MAG: PqqD family protein [Bacteroidetes bacterium]|nr:PqqD family protein [Bacteroidota bacterium]